MQISATVVLADGQHLAAVLDVAFQESYLAIQFTDVVAIVAAAPTIIEAPGPGRCSAEKPAMITSGLGHAPAHAFTCQHIAIKHFDAIILPHHPVVFDPLLIFVEEFLEFTKELLC